MHRAFVVAGIILVIIGLGLLALFPNLLYTPAEKVNIEDYKDGAIVKVYGEITDMEYSEVLNVTTMVLDGHLKVIIPGKFTNFTKGDVVYMEIQKNVALKLGPYEVAVWTSSTSNIYSVATLHHYFYFTSIAGAIVALIGVIIKK